MGVKSIKEWLNYVKDGRLSVESISVPIGFLQAVKMK